MTTSEKIEADKGVVNYTCTTTIDSKRILISINSGKVETGNQKINERLMGNIYCHKDKKGKYYYTSLEKRLTQYNGLTPIAFIKRFIQFNDIIFEVKERVSLFS